MLVCIIVARDIIIDSIVFVNVVVVCNVVVVGITSVSVFIGRGADIESLGLSIPSISAIVGTMFRILITSFRILITSMYSLFTEPRRLCIHVPGSILYTVESPILEYPITFNVIG